MGKVEDLASLGDAYSWTVTGRPYATYIFIDALPAEYEVEARNLASRDIISHDVIKTEQYHRLPGNRKKGYNACHAGHVIYASGNGEVAAGKVEAVTEKKADVGDSTDEAVETPKRAVVTRSRLLVAMAAAPKPPVEVPQLGFAIDVAGRIIGGATARRSYAIYRGLSHVRGISMQSMQWTGATLLMSALHRKKKLSWRFHARLGQGTTTKKCVRSSFR